MALMLGALRDALVAAGAPEDKATLAAEEVAGYEKDLSGVRSDLLLLKWMVGLNLALSVTGFSLAFGFLWQIALRLPQP